MSTAVADGWSGLRLIQRSRIQPARIVATKHDGSLHRSFDEAICLPGGSEIWWCDPGTEVVEGASHKRWTTPCSAFVVFPRGGFYNAVILNTVAGPEYYCNIASPPRIRDGHVYYVDYDVDVIVRGMHCEIADEDEYEVNAARYRYPVEIRERVAAQITSLRREAQEGTGVFAPTFLQRCKAIVRPMLSGNPA